MFDLFVSCIKNVYDNETVYDEFTKEEMEEFVESLDSKSLEKITEFFDTMPKLSHNVTLYAPMEDTKENRYRKEFTWKISCLIVRLKLTAQILIPA